MDYRTEHEKRMHDLVEDTMFFFGQRYHKANSIMSLMGRWRDMRVKLDNKEYGCPTGIHACACTCTTDKPGVWKPC